MISLRVRPLVTYLGISSKHRLLSSSSSNGVTVTYNEFGDPTKVLHKVEGRSLTDQTGSLGRSDVLVKMLAAPINPADLNMIQGVYPIKPDLPAVGGNEGVGRVVDVGLEVSNFSPGDWVVPAHAGWGTWRSSTVCAAGSLHKIANDISVTSAATLAVNPCSAYRMLKDFENLVPGDVVIQNGANSGVGQAVIQIAKERGILTVNIVRNRPDMFALKEHLLDLGATHVISDDFLRQPEMKNLMQSLPVPKLGLNCVGGRSTVDLLKQIAPNGTMVTYGAMSRQPLVIPAGFLIFNDVKVQGYWNTRWNNNNANSTEMGTMWEDLCNMVKAGTLKPPKCNKVDIHNFAEGIQKALQPFVTEKQLLVMDS